MRRSALLAGVSFSALVLTSSLVQADGYERKYVGPAPFTWTGMYVGWHTGGALGKTEIADPYGSAIFGDQVRTPGPFAGAQIGYNWQVGKTVYGLEADASWASLDGTNTCFAVSGAFISSNCHVHKDAFGTLTARLGYVVGHNGRTLLYLKGGAAWVREHVDATVNFPFGSVTDSSFTRWGWTAGGGAEFALKYGWSLKAEYDYLNFGRHDFVTSASLSQVTPGANAFVAVPGRTAGVSEDIHQFKLGVNYRFGAASDPAWGGSIKDSPPPQRTAGLEVEFGARYWYSWGRFQKDIGPGGAVPSSELISRLTYDDMKTHSGELFGRVDTPWKIFLKGFLGTGKTRDGKMNDEDWIAPPPNLVPYSNTLQPSVDGGINYGTIDAGYNWLRGERYKVGSFVGYNYFRQDMFAHGCVQVASPNNPNAPCAPANPGFGPQPTSAPGGIREDDTWKSVRVGTSAEYMLTNHLKISGDVAYLPYVKFEGVDRHLFLNTGGLASLNAESGHGTGVQLEAMISYAFTDHFSLGVGGRYWSMWTTNAETVRTCNNFGGGCVAIPPFPQASRFAVEHAGVLVQGSYKF